MIFKRWFVFTLFALSIQAFLFSDSSEVAMTDFDLKESSSEAEEESPKDEIDFKFTYKDAHSEPVDAIIEPENEEIAFNVKEEKGALAQEDGDDSVLEDYEESEIAQTEPKTKNPANVAEDPLKVYIRADMLQLFDASGNEFFIDRFPVTNKQYQRFVKETGHVAPKSWTSGKIPAGQEDQPVTDVNYQDAMTYGVWAQKRLPTEKEWIAAFRTGMLQFQVNASVKEWTSTAGEKNTKLVMSKDGSEMSVSKDTANLQIGFRLAADPLEE